MHRDEIYSTLLTWHPLFLLQSVQLSSKHYRGLFYKGCQSLDGVSPWLKWQSDLSLFAICTTFIDSTMGKYSVSNSHEVICTFTVPLCFLSVGCVGCSHWLQHGSELPSSSFTRRVNIAVQIFCTSPNIWTNATHSLCLQCNSEMSIITLVQNRCMRIL